MSKTFRVDEGVYGYLRASQREFETLGAVVSRLLTEATANKAEKFVSLKKKGVPDDGTRIAR